MKHAFFVILFFLLCTSVVVADSTLINEGISLYTDSLEEYIDSKFSVVSDWLDNLGNVLIDGWMNFLLSLFAAPVNYLVNSMIHLMVMPADFSLLYSWWQVIVYLLGLVWVIAMMLAGLYLMTAGGDVERRTRAKQWLRDLVVLAVVLPLSFWLYTVIVDLSAGFSAYFLRSVDASMFYLTGFDSVGDRLLKLFFYIPYVLLLFFTTILLLVRHFVVVSGVLVFPLGVFLYCVRPLRAFGRVCIDFLLTNIFSTVLVALCFLVYSVLGNTSTYDGVRVLLVFGALLIADVIIILLFVVSVLRVLWTPVRSAMHAVGVVKGLL